MVEDIVDNAGDDTLLTRIACKTLIELNPEHYFLNKESFQYIIDQVPMTPSMVCVFPEEV